MTDVGCNFFELIFPLKIILYLFITYISVIDEKKPD